MNEKIYSIRMHSSRRGQHISGAERLVPGERLQDIAAELVGRALEHSRGPAEQIRVSIDLVEPQRLVTAKLPDVTTVRVADYPQGRRAAREMLLQAGIGAAAIDAAIEHMTVGAAPDGSSMRGAMLIDAETGTRLEPDRGRGIRASRMDLSARAEVELSRRLAAQGLDNPHVREALVLAGKVLSAPGVVAELCWSDDPHYTAGYLATAELGYRRFPHLKPLGEERGGRAFFVRPQGLDLEALISYLESTPVLFDRIGSVCGVLEWEDESDG